MNIIIKEAKQDYKVKLNREQAETNRNLHFVSQSNKISSKKLRRKPNQIAPNIPFHLRKNWIKLENRFLPIMKIRSNKTNRVLKMDPSKYSNHCYLDSLNDFSDVTNNPNVSNNCDLISPSLLQDDIISKSETSHIPLPQFISCTTEQLEV